MRRPYIDFMGNRRWMFLASGVVLVIAIASLALFGLGLGIEFRGGSAITLSKVQGQTIETVRAAAAAASLADAQVQTTQGGFIIRSTETSTTAADNAGAAIASKLKVTSANTQVSTIGPEWGANITNAALVALTVSIIAILLYVTIRFEFKMAVTGVVALAHDVVITLGLYALLGHFSPGFALTPNTVAALLTIMGYSLYDTIVVFHRIRENTQNLSKKTFMQMANDSLNQVLARWVNTGLSSLIPVICLLVIGGSTLKDFAFALTVGLVSGAYSSLGVASPLYVLWKEREPRYQALAKKFAPAK